MASKPPVRLASVTIDCRDAEAVAAFYAELLGWQVHDRDGQGWVQLRDPGGGVGLNVQAEPAYVAPTWPEEPGAQQKMVHLELQVVDLPDAVARAEAAGGRQAPHQPPDRDPARIRVVLDPAGHPLCLFVAGE